MTDHTPEFEKMQFDSTGHRPQPYTTLVIYRTVEAEHDDEYDRRDILGEAETEETARLWCAAEELLAALEPFARKAAAHGEHWEDKMASPLSNTVGDFRRAAAAVAKARGEPK